VRYSIFYEVKGTAVVVLAVWHRCRGEAPALQGSVGTAD